MSHNHLLTVVSEMQDETVEFLAKLIQTPSENPPGDYVQIAKVFAGLCSRLGFEVSVVDAPEAECTADSLLHPRRNVIATLKGTGGGRNLLLNAHLDTVPVGDRARWTYSPFSGEIANGNIYGRGATDSKGRLTAYIMAAVALKRAGIPLKGDIVIAATCDEETGGRLGAGYLAKAGLVQADMAIVEGYSNQIIRAMAGALQLKIVVHGVSAHIGWKWKGVNAIDKMAHIVLRLEALQKELMDEPSSIPGMKYTAINVGVVSGGTKSNVVPETCEIHVECRVIPEHSLDDIRARIERAVNLAVSHDDALPVELIWLQKEDIEPTVIPEDSPQIEKLMNAIVETTGNTVPVVGVLGQSDARWFMQHGIPAVNFGPGTPENFIHHPDEHMGIADLITTIGTIAVFAEKFVNEA